MTKPQFFTYVNRDLSMQRNEKIVETLKSLGAGVLEAEKKDAEFVKGLHQALPADDVDFATWANRLKDYEATLKKPTTEEK